MAEQAKVAIVVGASGGIGNAVARRLAKDGFAIVTHYAGNPAKVDEAVNAIKAEGGKAIAAKADVASEDDVKALFKTALDAFGRIDVVVHTAGIMPMSKIADGDVATFDKVIATNLRGTYLVLSQSAQHVSEGGRIIAFSSSVLAKSFPAYGPTSPRRAVSRDWCAFSPTSCAAATSPSTLSPLVRRGLSCS